MTNDMAVQALLDYLRELDEPEIFGHAITLKSLAFRDGRHVR